MALEPQTAASSLSRHATWLALARASFRRATSWASSAFARSHSAGCCSPPEATSGSCARLPRSGRWPTWGDSALLLRELLGRRRVEPAALALIGTGLSGSAAALAFWLETRRADRGVSAS
jgi:hypothetical protein